MSILHHRSLELANEKSYSILNKDIDPSDNNATTSLKYVIYIEMDPVHGLVCSTPRLWITDGL